MCYFKIVFLCVFISMLVIVKCVKCNYFKGYLFVFNIFSWAIVNSSNKEFKFEFKKQ